MKLAKDEDGCESLLFGKKGIKLRPSVWRKAAMSNNLVETESNVCEEFVMYKPENPEKVREIANKYLTVM